MKNNADMGPKKTNPIQTQFLQKAKMNVNFCVTGYYESKPTFAANNSNLDINTAWSSDARIVA